MIPRPRTSFVAHTGFPVYEALEFSELAGLHEQLDPRVALYCNNGMRNFQSLLNGRVLHVHINHGESDKHSMLSNNAKAYDRVFVAGEAAVQRHLTGLMEFDACRLVRIGRPQLDLHPEPLLPPTDVVPSCTRPPGRATRTTTTTPRSTCSAGQS